MVRITVLSMFVVCMFVPPSASAEVLTVPGMYPTIQEAVDASSGPDTTIMVSPGTYNEWVNTYGNPAPSIMSTNPDDPTVVASTILQGGLFLDCFWAPSPSVVRISGLTIKGGGIACSYVGPAGTLIISNNVLSDCADAILIEGIYGPTTWIMNNNISNAITGIRASWSDNVPVYAIGNTISDCVAGIEGRFSDVIGNTIKNNLDSGAERMVFDEFAYNSVTGNWGTGLSLSPDSKYWGDRWDEPKPIHNNTFVRNDIGVILVPLSVTDSNTIAANDQAGVVINADALPEEPHDQILRNSIIYANGIAVEDPAGYGILSYCCSNASLPGEGNLVCDPLFVNPAAGDYHLSDASPCINRGTPEYDWQIATTDRDGDLRVIGGRIDIGSDETPYTPPPLAGDMNGDGTIDGLDVQLFIEAMLNQ